MPLSQHPPLLLPAASRWKARCLEQTAPGPPYMGPAGEASSRADAHNAQLLPLALRPFPSPAPSSSNVSLSSPTLAKTLTAAGSIAPWTPYSPYPESSSIMPSEPGASREPPVKTPPADQHDDAVRPGPSSEMNMIVGGALAPVSDVAPQRLVARSGPGLRLPSFEALGIASPHPHDLCLPGADNPEASAARENALSVVARSHSDPGPREESAYHAQHVGSGSDRLQLQPNKPCAHPQHTPLHRYVHTLTPPAETGEPTWRPAMMTAALDSPDTDAGNGRVSSQGETTDQSMKSASSAMQNISISTPAMKGERAWLESAVQSIRECCNFNFFISCSN